MEVIINDQKTLIGIQCKNNNSAIKQPQHTRILQIKSFITKAK
jgi:hypothetical protein